MAAKIQAIANHDADSLSIELGWLLNPENKSNNTFHQRLYNLYSYAFLANNQKLVDFLEARFRDLKSENDRVINLIIKEDK